MAELHERIRDWWDDDAHMYDGSQGHAMSDPVEAAAWAAALRDDARIDEDPDHDTFALTGAATPIGAAYSAEERLERSVEENAPEPGLVDAAATSAMDANEGQTGVEAEQEIAGQ